MTILLAIAAGGMLGFSIVLIVISIISYTRTKAVRMIPVAIAFLFLLFKGVLVALYALEINGDWLVYAALLDLPMVGLLAYSLLGP